MIYMDNHSTTRVDPRVVAAMLPYFSEEFGNAGSVHSLGQQAEEAVEESRTSIAANVGADAREIVFTSGATESNNLAIHGVAEQKAKRNKGATQHFVTVRTEHAAVLDPFQRLAKAGNDISLLEVEQYESPRAGWLDPQQVADNLRDNTSLVSVMLANNEIGVVQPLQEIANLCHECGVLLHCDATQAVGKLPVDVGDLGVDLMSFTSHKIYGPKGVGALYVRRRDPIVRLQAQITGGGQQEGRRSGTLNVPGIVGFAKALELCAEELEDESRRLAHLRDDLWQRLNEQIEGLQICGPALDATDEASKAGGNPLRLPGNLNLAFGDVDGEALLMSMDSLAISTGATCASSDPGPSHVLLALGMSEDLARSSLRFGLGRFNTAEETTSATQMVVQAVSTLREFSGK